MSASVVAVWWWTVCKRSCQHLRNAVLERIKYACGPVMVAHACKPSYLEGEIG
jgi:hypothetical protein